MNIDNLIPSLVSILKPIEQIINKKGRDRELKQIEKSKNRLQKSDVLVLICGEFKNGKSSLVNSIIEQDICPVDIDITTAAVSIIRYGEKNKAIRHFGIIDELKSEEIDFSQIDKFTIAGSSDSENTVFLEIEIPSEKLKSGMVLIDTPGVGGLDPRHGFLTSYFLSKADVAFFVTNAQDPFSSAELDFYKDKVIPVCYNPSIIVNKMDLKTNSDEILDDVKEKVSKYCALERSKINVIPYSSLLKLDFQKNGNKKDLEESNYVQVENAINRKIDEYKKYIFIDLCEFADQTLDEIKSPLIAQLEQLQSNKPIDVEALKSAYQERVERINELKDGSSDFRKKINRQIQDARSAAVAILQEQSILLSSEKLKQFIAEPKANAESIKNRIEEEISNLGNKIDQIILSKFDDLSRLFESQFREQMSLGYSYTSSIFTSVDQKSFSQKSFDFIRQNYSNVLVAGMMTSILAPFSLFIAIGTGIFLIWQGIKSFFKNDERERKIALQNAIIPQIQLATSNLNKYVNEKFNGFQYLIDDMISSEAKNAKSRVDEIVSAIQEIEKKDKEQKLQMKQLVEHEIRPIEQQQTYIRRLIEQASN